MSQDNLENVQAVVCPNCASLNYTTASYCTNCGHKLSSEETSENTSSNRTSQGPRLPGDNTGSYTQYTGCGYSYRDDPDFLSLLGTENSNYYLQKFSMMEATGIEISWNWAAFIFAPLWGIYRRLYVYAGISIAIMIFFPELYNNSGVMKITMALAWGLLGNYCYKKELEKKAQTVKTMSEPLRSQYIRSNSGTIF